MWRSGKVFVPHLLVTGLTNIGFRVLAGAWPCEGCRALGRRIRRLVTLAFRHPGLHPDRRNQDNKEAWSSACSQVHGTYAPYDLFGAYSRMNVCQRVATGIRRVT
jgi:hypothetical protein